MSVAVVTGPTNGGKTFTAEWIVSSLEVPGTEVKIFKTCTTRQRRPGETEQNKLTSYHFLTREEFETAIGNNEFFEYYELDKGTHYDYYGTRLKDLQEAVMSDILYIMVLDPVGAKKVQKMFPDRVKVVFLTPPSITELFRRAIKRNTDPIETVIARVYRSETEELLYQDDFDIKILNSDINTCRNEVSNFIIENFKNQKNN